MAEDNNIDISVGVRSDNAEKGLNRIEGGLTAVDSTGKKTAAHLVAHFQNVRSAIQKVQAVMSTVSFFTMWINAIGDLINKFKEWRRRAREAREEQERLAREATARKIEESASADAEAYRRLAKTIGDAAAEMTRLNALSDKRTGMLRNVEDEKVNAEEAQALSRVSNDDPDAEAKRTKIRNQFSVRRAELRAGRAEGYALQTARLTASQSNAAADQSVFQRKAAEQERARKLAEERAGLVSQQGQIRTQMEEAQRARGLAAGQLEHAWDAYNADSGSTPAEMQKRFQAAQRAESAAEKGLKQADSTISNLTRKWDLVTDKLAKLDAAMGRQSVTNDEN